MSRIATLIAVFAAVAGSGLLLGLSPAHAQRSPNWLLCENKDGKPLDQQITGCTAIIDSGREPRPTLAIAHNNRGIALFAKGDHDRALLDYNEAIRLLPNADYPYNNRGNLWLEKKNYDLAMADYDKAISLNPNNARAYNNRGKIWTERKQYDRALLDYEQAIKLAPSYANAFYNRGNVWRERRDRDRAMADYSEAIRLDPKDALAYTGRGNLWYEVDEYEKAIADYGQAIRLNPSHATTYFQRANALAGSRAYDRALSDYGQAIYLDNSNSAAYRYRGFVQFNLGDFGKAASDLARGAAGPVDAYAMLWLHLARVRAGAQDAKNELSQTATQLPATAWPRPIVEFYLGRRSLDDASAAATTPDQRCEISFYAGQWHILRNAKAAAQQALQKAVETCPKSFIEYRGALAELARLQQ